MRQVLVNSKGALLARMPSPVAKSEEVLVEVHYSMISIGTELAALRQPAAQLPSETSSLQRLKNYYQLLGKAFRNPKLAVGKLQQIAIRRINQLRPAQVVTADDGLSNTSRNELADTGWSVGYSAVGKILAIGEGISDLTI